ncbi:pilus assembly protein TadG-related protein [Lichenicoccus sp.]|uniref:pilus assembly protein TadG-related protein n=1 Tax=Lichenicoccus sp. TaxID=2781899 RepID=UPI003D0F99DE
MQMIKTMPQYIRSLRNSRQGAVAVLVALMLTPLIAGAGVAVDYSRESLLKASLQSIVDDAALAGASNLNQTTSTSGAITLATSYFNRSVATIANSNTVSGPTVQVPNSITVTVSATAQLGTTLMGIFEPNMQVAVTATAMGPGYAIKVSKTGGFTSTAYDGDSIYFYVVPPGGGYPTSLSSYTLLFTNSSAVDPNYEYDNANPKAIAVGPNDQVGFALYNTNGGKTPYGTNGYGAAQGSTHIFLSSLAAPSQDPAFGYPNQPTYNTGSYSYPRYGRATCNPTPIGSTNPTFASTAVNSYSTDTTSCITHPCVTQTGAGLMNNNLLINGVCSTQATAVQTCLQLYNNPTAFRWNDMGGGSDDFNYNDANYTVSCQPNTTGTSILGQPKAVILTN